MGLDISYYGNIKKINCHFNADGEPIDKETGQEIERSVMFWVAPGFEDRSQDIEIGSAYSYDDAGSFYAGAYSSYNRWRESLARLAGYPLTEYDGQERADASAWAGKCEGMPFVYLVNFSDCEGVTSSKFCSILAKDFCDFDDRAKQHGDGFYKLYSLFLEAFNVAKNNGAVKFR